MLSRADLAQERKGNCCSSMERARGAAGFRCGRRKAESYWRGPMLWASWELWQPPGLASHGSGLKS